MGSFHIKDGVAHHYHWSWRGLLHAHMKDIWVGLVLQRGISALDVREEGRQAIALKQNGCKLAWLRGGQRDANCMLS